MACANFYNASIAKANKPPPNWSFGFNLSSKHVWLAFLLYCSLENVTKQHKYLVVKHTGDQKDCFTMLLQACNKCMQIEGQPELTHFCNKCICVTIGTFSSTDLALFLKCILSYRDMW